LDTEALDPVEDLADQLLALASRLRDARRTRTVDGLLEVLRVAEELEHVADGLVGPVVAVLRRFEVSWLDIASALGLSRQSVWDRYHDSGGRHREVEERLAATTVSPAHPSTPELHPASIYTRVELGRLFSIKDATIKNGVFPFKERQEIWLFITEQKTSDRVQYEDELLGDELYWQGQTFGRTDRLIIGHRDAGDNILVFYRKSKTEIAGAGFRFEGVFDYVSHSGGSPTSFILKRRRRRGPPSRLVQR